MVFNNEIYFLNYQKKTKKKQAVPHQLHELR